MSPTSRISALNRSVQDAASWLRELARTPPFRSEEEAYAAFHAVLHALRDRLEMHEAVHLAGQMPTLVRGIYYEGWVPSATPKGERTRAEFLDDVLARLGPSRPADPVPIEPATRAVLAFLETKFDAGQIRHVREQMPREIQELWPSPAAATPAGGRRNRQTA